MILISSKLVVRSVRNVHVNNNNYETLIKKKIPSKKTFKKIVSNKCRKSG